MPRNTTHHPLGISDDRTILTSVEPQGGAARVVAGSVIRFTRAEQMPVSCYDSLEA